MNARHALRLAGVWALAAAGMASAAEERLDFRTRILPILTKAGCNAGSCHGAAVGQGGFKLSLLGYDPVQDHVNITRERGGRRVDVEAPATSLILRKATDKLEHDGGRRIKPGSDAYQTLSKWIANGAPFGPADLRVTGIEVEPSDILLSDAGQTAQLHVAARLSDGTREEVSALALYSTNDDAVAEVKSSGLVTTRGRGVTSVMVRYAGQVAAARVGVPFEGAPVKTEDFAARNFVDAAVLAELQRLNLTPSPLSEDAEFLRRVYLDVIGRLPTAHEVRTFLHEPPSDAKRSRLITALLAREEFVDYWAMKFGDWLLISGKRGGELPTRTYHAWVREQLAGNVPLNTMVRDLLLGQGDMGRVGPANFYTLATDPRDLGEHVSSLFLGTQIACARCHAHPADRWTQVDYHAFAAYFARVTQQGGSVRIAERGEVEHPKTRRPVAPRPLDGAANKTETGDPRAPLADWLVSPDNPMLARNLVNRVWKHLLGRGLVEPVDDLRPTNPPANPALLHALTANFVQHQFDLRWLLREIASSRTYQLSSRTTPANRADERLFSHAYVKPLPAQVLADAVAQVTGVPDQFPDYPAGTRAVQLVGAQTPSQALDVLGRCTRERSCDGLRQSGRRSRASVAPHQWLDDQRQVANRRRKDSASWRKWRGYRRTVCPRAFPSRHGGGARGVGTVDRNGLGCHRRSPVGFAQLPRILLQPLAAVNTAFSSPSRCDGIARRDFLHLGLLSAFGLSVSDVMRLQGATATPARARSCILIWLDGGPSHLDTFDPKPEAPSEVRSQFRGIGTSVAGIQICEHLPLTARIMHEVALIRSLTHELGNHDTGTRFLLTGHRPTPALEYPSLGSLVANEAGFGTAVPPYIAIPGDAVGGNSNAARSGYLPVRSQPSILAPIRRACAI